MQRQCWSARAACIFFMGVTLALTLRPDISVAGITVIDSTYAENLNWAPTSISSNEFIGLNLNGATKLLVTLSGRDSSGFSSVTFNGASLTKVVSLSGPSVGGTMRCSIWYLDYPGTVVGDLAFSGGVRGVGATFWALKGTSDGVGNSASNSSLSVSLTTSASNSLVIANTGAIIGTSTTAPVAQSPLNDGPSGAMNYANKNNEYEGIGSGYQTVVTAGSVIPTFDYGDVTVAAEFLESQGPSISLVGDNVASNAPPGTLVGTLSLVNTNGTFTYAMETDSGDDAYFDIASGTTNLRTAAWIDKASFNISIVGTESGGGGLVVTNAFTITVDAVSDARPTFVVSAEVQNGAANGTVVGTAQTIEPGATFSIVSGRSDLFYFEGPDLKVTNSADWGSVGTTNYVTLQAVAGSGTNELVVAAGVVSGATSGTVFIFM